MFKKIRWFVVLMLFLAGVINYVDRAAFSVAAPFITEEYGIDSIQLGFIFSSFSIGYALFNFVGGYLSDIYGPRKIFGASMTIWSIFCGLTIAAFNFVSLFIIRMLFGLGEGPLGSATNKTISNWVPAKQRARAVGISFSGNPLGGALAGPIVGIIALYWHWKLSFIVLAVIGLIWTVFWMKLVTDKPSQHPKAAQEEIDEMQEPTAAFANSKDSKGEKVSLSYFIKQPTILFTALAFFGFNYILYFFMTWFPSYLSMDKGLSIKEMSIASTIPWLVGFCGLLLSGVLSDYLYRKTNKLLLSRKIVLVSGLLLSSICIAFAGLVQTPVSAVTLMACGIFFMYMTSTSYWSIISDNVKGDKVGGVTGFVHALANISGIIAPTVTGFIVQYTGHFTSAFLTAGALAIIGAVGVIFFVKPIALKAEL
ncbi:MFS transporter, ACS family, hexuronate transporter [Paenibacillus algorifonticola]|uniref:MFS transporter, ACS family, hexuronate transporter n=1 Tax=Paenibacillus algorifonticola TaxID=684063 RepID=A0A1I2I7R0_9BACL|nr:MFS transporter [Paenibacillus algorifonticola]SFF37683.1 MFS transporter, ACS family, hexuronate transporter [Paenibacillus algorifonticola]